jgi:TonB family protein
MQLNGQGSQQGSSVRWSTRLRDVLHGKPQKIQRLRGSVKIGNLVESGHALNSGISLPLPVVQKRSEYSNFGGDAYDTKALAMLGFVILMHIAGLYIITRVSDIQMPAVSVPLTISFALSEPAQEKPKIKPKPKPQVLADAPIPDEKPVEESQPQVIPPEYKVAHLNNPVPPYPPLSRRLREQGDVILRVYVEPDGTPGQIQLHTSSGFTRLDQSAQDTVGRWKFIPARRGDGPVGAWVLVPINYVLN